MMRKTSTATAVLAGSLLLSACGNSTTESSTGSTGSTTTSNGSTAAAQQMVTIYSGRNEALVGPLLSQVESATGTKIDVRYGDSSALAAQLLEEGDRSPADVFFSQDAGALGALAKAGRVSTLDSSTTGAVLKGYADANGSWVATSARARVVAYDPASAPEAETFTSIDAILDLLARDVRAIQKRGHLGDGRLRQSFPAQRGRLGRPIHRPRKPGQGIHQFGGVSPLEPGRR